MTSQEDIERLRRAYAAFSRGDFDAAVDGLAHPEMEFVSPGGQTPLRGAGRFRSWMEPDAFEWQVIEPLDFRIAGNKILIWQHTKNKGAGSGIEMEIYAWTVWTFDDGGLVTRVEGFLPHQEAEALEAAGLQG